MESPMQYLADMPWVIFLVASFIIPAEMLAGASPRRSDFARRSVACLVGLFLIMSLAHKGLMAVREPTVFDLSTYTASIVSFGLTILVLVASLMACHDLTLSAATFCATAAYTMQNMGQMVGNLLAETCPFLTPLFLVPHSADLVGAVTVYGVCYPLLAKKVRSAGLTSVDEKKMLAMTPVVIFVNIIASLPFKDLSDLGMPPQGIVIFRLLHLTTCSLMLLIEFELLVNGQLRVEQASAERVLEERRRQYALSRDTIEAINVKCHDIRHQIRAMDAGTGKIPPSALQEIAHEVSIYDSAVTTGNEALDTILTEKSLVCERSGIALSCIADGELLDQMAPSDIYALFGNALDNAIEAERRVADASARSVSVVVREVAGMTSVHIENYCTEPVEFRDGRPLTTKHDEINHGFGTRSMQLIVEKYDGTIVMGREQDCFFVNALIPELASA